MLMDFIHNMCSEIKIFELLLHLPGAINIDDLSDPLKFTANIVNFKGSLKSFTL